MMYNSIHNVILYMLIFTNNFNIIINITFKRQLFIKIYKTINISYNMI